MIVWKIQVRFLEYRWDREVGIDYFKSVEGFECRGGYFLSGDEIRRRADEIPGFGYSSAIGGR